MSPRGFSVVEGDEGALDGEVEGNGGSDTEGTTGASLIRGSSVWGRTTGLECGGGVADGRTDGVRGTTFTADGIGVYSMGGWSPPMFATSGSAGAASVGAGIVTTPVLIATPASTPIVTRATPSEREGSGKPERTRHKVATE